MKDCWEIDERAEWLAQRPEFQLAAEQLRNELEQKIEKQCTYIFGLDMGSGEDKTVWSKVNPGIRTDVT